MLIPALVALVGLVLYFVGPGKLSGVGYVLFVVGTFWLVALFAHERVRF